MIVGILASGENGAVDIQRSANWTDRQLPVGDQVFLDHFGYFVADLETAGLRLKRLGFQVTPINSSFR